MWKKRNPLVVKVLVGSAAGVLLSISAGAYLIYDAGNPKSKTTPQQKFRAATVANLPDWKTKVNVSLALNEQKLFEIGKAFCEIRENGFVYSDSGREGLRRGTKRRLQRQGFNTDEVTDAVVQTGLTFDCSQIK